MISLHNKSLKKKIYEICKKNKIKTIKKENFNLILNKLKEEVQDLSENEIISILSTDKLFDYISEKDTFVITSLSYDFFKIFYEKQPKEKIMEKINNKINYLIKGKDEVFYE